MRENWFSARRERIETAGLFDGRISNRVQRAGYEENQLPQRRREEQHDAEDDEPFAAHFVAGETRS